MTDILDRPWRSGPALPPDDGALDAFRVAYTGPILVNGQPTPLIERVRADQEILRMTASLLGTYAAD